MTLLLLLSLSLSAGIRRVAANSHDDDDNGSGSAVGVTFVFLLMMITSLCVCMCFCQRQRRERAEQKLALQIYYHQQLQQQQQQQDPQQEPPLPLQQGNSSAAVPAIVTGKGTTTTTTTTTDDDDDDLDKRLPLWILLVAFSVICMNCIITSVKERRSSTSRSNSLSFDDSHVKWALAMASLSCALATITVLCYLICAAQQQQQHSLVLRRAIESVMCIWQLGFWGIALYKIIDPATVADGRVYGYFDISCFLASWICFALVVLLIFSVGQEVAGCIVKNPSTLEKARLWYLLAVTSLVILGSSILQRKHRCDSVYRSDRNVCKHSKYAIFVGIFGWFLASAMTVLLLLLHHPRMTNNNNNKFALKAWMELCPIVVLLLIGSVRFKHVELLYTDSPGYYNRTLYFSFGISFLLIVLLFGIVLKELVKELVRQRRRGQPQAPQQQLTRTLQVQESRSDGTNRLDLQHTTASPTELQPPPQPGMMQSSVVVGPTSSSTSDVETAIHNDDVVVPAEDAMMRDPAQDPQESSSNGPNAGSSWVQDVSQLGQLETQPNGQQQLIKVVRQEIQNPDGTKTVKVQRFFRNKGDDQVVVSSSTE